MKIAEAFVLLVKLYCFEDISPIGLALNSGQS